MNKKRVKHGTLSPAFRLKTQQTLPGANKRRSWLGFYLFIAVVIERRPAVALREPDFREDETLEWFAVDHVMFPPH